jgi:DNA repair exonuclease SbcCD ATPase subunit
MGDGSTFTSEDLADEYERHHSGTDVHELPEYLMTQDEKTERKLRKVEQDLMLANRAHNSAARGRMEAEKEVAELRRAMRNLGEKYNELSAENERLRKMAYKDENIDCFFEGPETWQMAYEECVADMAADREQNEADRKALLAQFAEFRSHHQGGGCGVASGPSFEVGYINDVIPPDRVEDGEE